MTHIDVAVVGDACVGKSDLLHRLGAVLMSEATPDEPFDSYQVFQTTAIEVSLTHLDELMLDALILIIVFDLRVSASFASVVAKTASLLPLSKGATILVACNAEDIQSDHEAILLSSEAQLYASTEFSFYLELKDLTSVDTLKEILCKVLSERKSADQTTSSPCKEAKKKKIHQPRDIWLYDPYDDNSTMHSPTKALNDIFMYGRAKALAQERVIASKYQCKHYAKPKMPIPRQLPPPAPVVQPKVKQSHLNSVTRCSTLMCSTQSSIERVKATKAHKPPVQVDDPKIRVKWHRSSSIVALSSELSQKATKCHRNLNDRQSRQQSVHTTKLLEDQVKCASVLSPTSEDSKQEYLVAMRCPRHERADAPVYPFDTVVECVQDEASLVGLSHEMNIIESPVHAAEDLTQPDDDNDISFDDQDILQALDSFQLSL